MKIDKLLKKVEKAELYSNKQNAILTELREAIEVIEAEAEKAK